MARHVATTQVIQAIEVCTTSNDIDWEFKVNLFT